MIPEIKTLFERSNNGRKRLTDTLPPGRRIHEEKVKTQPPKDEEWSNYAVLLVEHSDDDGHFQHKSLRIQSPFLKELLRNTIKDYPGENFDTYIPVLQLPIKSFFHYLHELKEEENSISKDYLKQDDMYQLRCLTSWIENEYRQTILEHKNLVSGGAITFDLHWFSSTRTFQVEGWYVDTDGTNLGRRDYTMSIDTFDGSQLIANLEAIPLSQHPNKEAITKQLSERGKRFYSLQGQHHRVYRGVALQIGQGSGYRYVHGRVIVDGASFGRFNPDDRIRIETDDPAFDTCKEDDRYILCSSWVSGFALKENKWFRFLVDEMNLVKYDEDAFGSLVLQKTQKDMLRAMVNDHVNGKSQFDDIITGKGKGLVTVLHGPPGVGKTLAVESVAEHTKRPVYSASSRDLGSNPQEVDAKLVTILECVATWNAILLLDEADAFLEQRSGHDLTRNALVSIFLRRLEYFQGIMFLTTNRVTTFDHALQSRIHLSLRLGELSRESRLKIWRNFLTRSDGTGNSQFDSIKDRHYHQLAKRNVNGRQIKNAVRMAQILASDNGGKVQVEDIHKVLDLQDDFHKDPNDSNTGLWFELQNILILGFYGIALLSILYVVRYY